MSPTIADKRRTRKDLNRYQYLEYLQFDPFPKTWEKPQERFNASRTSKWFHFGAGMFNLKFSRSIKTEKTKKRLGFQNKADSDGGGQRSFPTATDAREADDLHGLR